MDVAEIAKLLKRHPETIRRKVRNGLLPYYRAGPPGTGQRLLFDREEVLEAMQQPKQDTTPRERVVSDRLMDVAEIAKLLKRHPETIRRKVRNGLLPYYRAGPPGTGQRLLFDREEVLEAMQQPHKDGGGVK